MSVSHFLICSETKQAVHVAEQSSGWFRGADSSPAVGLFCLAHAGKHLECTRGDDIDTTEYVVWEACEATKDRLTVRVRMFECFEVQVPYDAHLVDALLKKIEQLWREQGPQAYLRPS